MTAFPTKLDWERVPVEVLPPPPPRYGGWIQTWSGLKFYPADPDPGDVRIADIARALSHLCRFAGHVRSFYSVAQHSVLCSLLVPPEDALWGLLHDATEAYLVDVPKPVKDIPEFGIYHTWEDRLEEAVAERFGLTRPMPPSVKWADVALVVTERRDLMGTEVIPWGRGVDPLPQRIVPWGAKRAEAEFLARFEVLYRGRCSGSVVSPAT